jgi:S1-C subfamily serine protease
VTLGVVAVVVAVTVMAASVAVMVAHSRSGGSGKAPADETARAIPPDWPADDPEPPRDEHFSPPGGATLRRPAFRSEVEERDERDEPAPRAAGGQLSARVLRDLKGATVFLKVEAGKASCSGSGFLVKVEGDTAYLVTNNHVVNPQAALLRPLRTRDGGSNVVIKVQVRNAAVTAVFNSGTPAERSLPAEVITTDSGCDLAVLRVTGDGIWPRPIALEDRVRLVETMPVYILGFPFGEALAFKRGNPAVTVNKGSISSLRQDDYGQIKAVQIDGAINPGNSGGPVVDEAGRLVGVSAATIRGSGIGLAIAPEELKKLFDARDP